MVAGDGVVLGIVELAAEVAEPGAVVRSVRAEVKQADAIQIAIVVFDCELLRHCIHFFDSAGSYLGVQASFFKLLLVPSQVVDAKAAGRGVKRAFDHAPRPGRWREEIS